MNAKKKKTTKQPQTYKELCLLPDATVVISSISCTFLSFKWRGPLGTGSAPVHSYPCHPAVLRARRCEAHTIRPRLLREDYSSGQGQGSSSGVLGTLWFSGTGISACGVIPRKGEPGVGGSRPRVLLFAFIVCDRRHSSLGIARVKG